MKDRIQTKEYDEVQEIEDAFNGILPMADSYNRIIELLWDIRPIVAFAVVDQKNPKLRRQALLEILNRIDTELK